jgi:hypothetical protein
MSIAETKIADDLLDGVAAIKRGEILGVFKEGGKYKAVRSVMREGFRQRALEGIVPASSKGVE